MGGFRSGMGVERARPRARSHRSRTASGWKLTTNVARDTRQPITRIPPSRSAATINPARPVQINGRLTRPHLRFAGRYSSDNNRPTRTRKLHSPLPNSIPIPVVAQIYSNRSLHQICFHRFSRSRPIYGEESVPRSLGLPRRGVREVTPERRKLDYREYPESEAGQQFYPDRSRSLIAGSSGSAAGNVTPIRPPKRRINLAHYVVWHPYLQSQLKGDAPVIGQDIFLNLTLSNFSQFETRRLADSERGERGAT